MAHKNINAGAIQKKSESSATWGRNPLSLVTVVVRRPAGEVTLRVRFEKLDELMAKANREFGSREKDLGISSGS